MTKFTSLLLYCVDFICHILPVYNTPILFSGVDPLLILVDGQNP